MANVHAAGCSKTYRNATKLLARRLGLVAHHTTSPKLDFQTLAHGVHDPDTIALHYYRLGLRRGIRKATDMVASGQFVLQGDELTGPPSVEVRMKLRLPNTPKRKTRFKFRATELGFD